MKISIYSSKSIVQGMPVVQTSSYSSCMYLNLIGHTVFSSCADLYCVLTHLCFYSNSSFIIGKESPVSLFKTGVGVLRLFHPHAVAPCCHGSASHSARYFHSIIFGYMPAHTLLGLCTSGGI